MLKIIIYTVAGQPSFMLDADTTAVQIRRLVEDRFGWLAIGLPHTWYAIFS